MTTVRRVIAFALAASLSATLFAVVPCAADQPVTLREGSELRHPAVRLSDLFDGVPSGIDRDIAQAPAPCRPAVYDANVLAKLAQRYRLDWQPQSGAERAVVTSACTRITADEMGEAVVQKLKEERGIDGSKVEVIFDNRALQLELPAGRSAHFELTDFDYDPLAHRFRAELAAEGEHGLLSLPLTGRVMIKRRVPVLAHRLEGGTVIGPSDIAWIDVPEDRIGVAVVTDDAQLIGRELRRATTEGDVLHTNDVIMPRLVLRGATVTMKIETPMMQITAQGRALQDGAEGETVRVVNLQSNRMVEGKVTAPGVVTISVARRMAEARSVAPGVTGVP